MAPALDWQRDGADWPLREHSQFMQLDHVRWHVQAMGPTTPSSPPGPDILLLHGTGASCHSWAQLMPLLAQHHKVTAIDLPGHAFTQGAHERDLSLRGMAGCIAGLVQTLFPKACGSADPRPLIIVGHSAGAAVALELHLQQAQWQLQVISLNGALLPWGGVAGAMFMPMARVMATNSLVAKLFAWSARKPGTIEELLRQTGSQVDARSQALYARLATNEAHVHAVLTMMSQWDLADLLKRLPHVQCPVDLIVSAGDLTVPPSVGRQAAQRIPHARLHEWPRGGHLLHEEAPEEALNLIRECLNRLEARGGVEPP